MISYIIWNGSPEIFSIGFFSLRYYGLLFALGFLISQQILYYIYKKEGKPEKDVDTLTVYMIIATIMLVPFYLTSSFGDSGFSGFWLAQQLLLSSVSFGVLAWFIVRYARVFVERVNK